MSSVRTTYRGCDLDGRVRSPRWCRRYCARGDLSPNGVPDTSVAAARRQDALVHIHQLPIQLPDVMSPLDETPTVVAHPRPDVRMREQVAQTVGQHRHVALGNQVPRFAIGNNLGNTTVSGGE